MDHGTHVELYYVDHWVETESTPTENSGFGFSVVRCLLGGPKSRLTRMQKVCRLPPMQEEMVKVNMWLSRLLTRMMCLRPLEAWQC